MQLLPASTLQLVLGGFLAAGTSLIAWRLRWLTGGGAWAAFVLGLVVFGLGGFAWAVVLLAFFIPSSILSLIFKKRKSAAERFYEKNSQRDAGQVLANGLIAGCFVVLHVFFPDSWLPWTGFASALAAAAADTWATELGVLSKRAPVMITNWKKVDVGTSGAVTLFGSAAAVAGALLIAAIAWLCWPVETIPVSGWWIPAVTLAGLAGCMIDSLLGARLQAIYFCPACKKETEQPRVHGCGTATTFRRGWRWMDNDWVNLVCTLSAAAIALGVISLFIVNS